MKKGELISEETLKAILILAVIAVSFYFIAPVVIDLLKEKGYIGTCEVSVVLNSMSKQTSVAGVKLIPELPIKCRPVRETISKTSLQKYDALAKQVLNRQIGTEGSVETRTDWALKKSVADQIMSCYDRGWRGNLDLVGAGWFDSKVSEPEKQLCLLCARLRTDPAVKAVLGGADYVKLSEWLKLNNYEAKSYYDILTSDVTPFQKEIIDNYVFDLNNPVAVLFVAGVEKDAVSGKSVSRGQVMLVKYEDISTNLGFANKGPSFNPFWLGPQLGALSYVLQESKYTFDPDNDNLAYCAAIIGD